MAGAFDTSPLLLPDLIAHHGRWRASQPALWCGVDRRSWREFDLATLRVANGLRALGLTKGARLGVLMSNSIAMVELMFGAARAGVSVVPINVAVPDTAVRAMLDDSGASAIAASGEHCARVDAVDAASGPGAARVRIGVGAPSTGGWIEYADWLASQGEVPLANLGPEDECNIIYSSGTTGLPKGIVHSHGCRMNWANDLALALRYHSGAVTVCSIGLYSNIMWVSMLATMLVGGTLVVMPAFSPAALFDEIERRRVTHGAFVPVQLQRLLDADPESRELGSLQTLMCCGSPLPPTLKRAVPARLGCDLIELYGLTEGLVTTLDPEHLERHIESVGKPIPGQQLQLVGADDQPVAAGEAGEVVGLGRLTMQGYHNRPDATAEATWVDPEGRRWLRTGDIGRLDDEGFLHIVDRKKDLIISGGQNIYPADIEAVLCQHPQVQEVAVIGVPSDRWGETPLALVVPRSGEPGPEAALLEWVNARLGRQQRVSALRFVGSLPRNPNGKVLKRELRREHSS
jgi:long-chain acyl-CoA synthetase